MLWIILMIIIKYFSTVIQISFIEFIGMCCIAVCAHTNYVVQTQNQ